MKGAEIREIVGSKIMREITLKITASFSDARREWD